MLSPAQRRRAVRHVQEVLHVSQRRACRALGQPRSSQRYLVQQRNGERELTEAMRKLALRHPRYGYRRVSVLLRRDGWRINRKRVHRLWRKEGLKVPQKPHKRRRLMDGSSDNAAHRLRAERINHMWSFDFCHDRTADGRGIKIFSVIDEFTRQCLGIEAQRHITGADVVATLERLMTRHGAPQHVRCDNGPEFVCAVVRAWLSRRKISPLYIEPGSPWENGYVESYHARLRDELLMREEFATLLEARALLELWRQEYNQDRPHGALGYLTPEAFASACRAKPCSATLRLAQNDEEESVMETVAQ
jgi:putative transposase